MHVIAPAKSAFSDTLLGVCDDGLPFGHAFQWHHPDFTWEDDTKALTMARRAFEDLRHYRAHNSQYPNTELATEDPPDPAQENGDPAWNNIRARVSEFLIFQPRTFLNPLETVTRQGYVDKVRVLFPGYSIATKSDENQWLRARPTGAVRSFEVRHGAMDLMDLGNFSVIGQ